jgi:primase-polymerase (primpol)-like protein
MRETITPPKPTALLVNLDGIPKELKDRPQWVLWRFVLRTDKKTGKREWAKVPFQVSGEEAKADDPSTWSDFAAVAKTYQANLRFWAGIGFEFSADDPFVGIDLDGCRRDDRAFVPWASELRAKFAVPGVPDAIDIIKRLVTYAEVSPSEHGVKLIGEANLPGSRNRIGNKQSGAEFYDRGRFFTITGHQIPGTPATINECTKSLAEIYCGIFGDLNHKNNRKTFGKGRPRIAKSGRQPTDQEVLGAIFNAKNSEKVKALLDGDAAGYASESEADMALACHLRRNKPPGKAARCMNHGLALTWYSNRTGKSSVLACLIRSVGTSGSSCR